MSSLLKNLLFALGFAVLLWLGYTLFLNKDDLAETGGDATSEAAIEAQAFRAKLQALRAIDIDDGIFNDPRFSSLADFKITIEEEPTGRNNPFAPIR